MTKRHFEAIAMVNHAAMVRAYAGPDASAACNTLRMVIIAQSAVFSEINPRFDREKFYLASGLTIAGWTNTHAL